MGVTIPTGSRGSIVLTVFVVQGCAGRQDLRLGVVLIQQKAPVLAGEDMFL